MIFPNLIHEKIIQIGDKTRFNAKESFVTGSSVVSDVLIDAGEGYISVFSQNKDNWFLDWAFDTEGTKEIKLKIELEDESEKEVSFFIDCLTEEKDALFSSDSQLFAWENELQYQFPQGKNSFKYAHRNSQNMIIRYLDGEGIRKKDGSPFSKQELAENVYISEWSAYQTIINLLEDQRITDSDIFNEKKKSYMARLIDAKKNAAIRLDYDDNGEIENHEIKNVQMKYLTR
jgi:hypothetical protein